MFVAKYLPAVAVVATDKGELFNNGSALPSGVADDLKRQGKRLLVNPLSCDRAGGTVIQANGSAYKGARLFGQFLWQKLKCAFVQKTARLLERYFGSFGQAGRALLGYVRGGFPPSVMNTQNNRNMASLREG